MDMQDVLQKVMESTSYIKNIIPRTPEVAIILGSGLGNLTSEIRDVIEIPYETIPNFKTSSVQGHDNKLIYGTIYGKPVLAMKGRYHYYEGYTMQEVTFPIKVFALLGISKLIVSNAAGGINKKYKAGDIMLISDHIKLCGDSPLIGPNIEEFGTRFPDMKDAYSKEFRELAKEVARKLKIEVQEGVYAYMTGPQYETPAEIKMLSILGADAVGMSTVPEVITAVHAGMDVLGISCITDETQTDQKISHAEVMEVVARVEEKFVDFVIEIINNL